MAKYLLVRNADNRITGGGDLGSGNPATIPAVAGFSHVWDAGFGGSLTEAEYQLAGSGERPSWVAANAPGSRVVENPFPRIRFTPNTIDTNVGVGGLSVLVRAENRDGTPRDLNGTFLLYKTVNGQKQATRVTLSGGQLSLPVDTSVPRYVEVSDQPTPDGNDLRAKVVAPLRITVADTDL